MRTNTNSSKLLIFIIGVLLLTNIAMIFLFVLPARSDKMHHRPSFSDSGMAPVLRNEVGFTAEQIKTYETLRANQRNDLKQLFIDLRKSRENFYNGIYTMNGDDSLTGVRADSIAFNQKQLDIHMYHYFTQIRNLATPQQLPQFDSSLKKVLSRMIGKPGRSKSRK